MWAFAAIHPRRDQWDIQSHPGYICGQHVTMSPHIKTGQNHLWKCMGAAIQTSQFTTGVIHVTCCNNAKSDFESPEDFTREDGYQKLSKLILRQDGAFMEMHGGSHPDTTPKLMLRYVSYVSAETTPSAMHGNCAHTVEHYGLPLVPII